MDEAILKLDHAGRNLHHTCQVSRIMIEAYQMSKKSFLRINEFVLREKTNDTKLLTKYIIMVLKSL